MDEEAVSMLLDMDDETAILMLEMLQDNMTWNDETCEVIQFCDLSQDNKFFYTGLTVGINALYERMRSEKWKK